MIDDGSGLSLAEWVTAAIGVIGFLAAQLWAAVRYLSSQFAKRDAASATLGAKLENLSTAVRAETQAHREQMRGEFARVDRDIAGLRSEVRERLAVMPTVKDLDNSLRDRIGPLEGDLRALTLQLAENGIRAPHRRPREEG